jgi:ribosome recycling factor
MSNQEATHQAKDKMEKSIVSLQQNLAKLRTGRASLAVLDGIKVDYYGTLSPLNQVASLAIPEPRLITIQPWETNLLQTIEKAIEKANIGLTPNNDGKIIRLPIPQLTEERRKEIVKSLKAMAEEARVAIRHVRRDANEVLKKLQKDSKITEDELKKGTEQIQKMTDETISQVDKIAENKEQDIMKV